MMYLLSFLLLLLVNFEPYDKESHDRTKKEIRILIKEMEKKLI